MHRPDQAEMSDLDVCVLAGNIYSLGVLLYELLTSKTPFDPKELVQHGLDEMRRKLREQEPQLTLNHESPALQGAELMVTAKNPTLNLPN